MLCKEANEVAKPVFNILSSTMVHFNWIEQHEAEEGRIEYDTFVVDLVVNCVVSPLMPSISSAMEGIWTTDPI